jgi:hypothetical protein
MAVSGQLHVLAAISLEIRVLGTQWTPKWVAGHMVCMEENVIGAVGVNCCLVGKVNGKILF